MWAVREWRDDLATIDEIACRVLGSAIDANNSSWVAEYVVVYYCTGLNSGRVWSASLLST
jgi:hypothetical protein